MGNRNKRQHLSVTLNLTGPNDLTGANLGPLVLANPILEKMEIRRLVDRHCPADPRLEIPIGDVEDIRHSRKIQDEPKLVFKIGFERARVSDECYCTAIFSNPIVSRG